MTTCICIGIRSALEAQLSLNTRAGLAGDGLTFVFCLIASVAYMYGLLQEPDFEDETKFIDTNPMNKTENYQVLFLGLVLMTMPFRVF